MSGEILTVLAPAKLNLFFEVLGKRPDGYHEIETVTVRVDWCDTLRAERLPQSDAAGPLRLETVDEAGNDVSATIRPEEHLVRIAASALAKKVGVFPPVSLRLTKRIPSKAGLGGGSSDAAATLWVLNQLWKTDLSRDELIEIGAKIGSDVPLFFEPGIVHGKGRGEQITALGEVPKLVFVLKKPPFGLSTAEVYSACTIPRSGERRSATELIFALKSGDLGRIGDGLFNRLEESAEKLRPELACLRKSFAGDGILAARMTGSGTCLYGICRDRAAADAYLSEWKNSPPDSRKGEELFIAETVPHHKSDSPFERV